MTGREAWAERIDDELRDWRQGDVSLDSGLEFIHLADPSRPHSRASVAAVGESGDETQMTESVPVVEAVEGMVVLTQTCDIVRSCRDRPFVEIAPLARLDDQTVEQVRRLKRPAFAYVPATAKNGLVADLERVMTVEKAVVANWRRTPGWETEAVEIRVSGRLRPRGGSAQAPHNRQALPTNG
ncbi:MAG: hypothetical protein OXC70_07340 [Gammaproteobacteria bacterium]|nr:hypothetical protein [Gammaproteobacteria bacterium]